MSDYLNNIVLRAGNVADAIQPRVVSLFAPLESTQPSPESDSSIGKEAAGEEFKSDSPVSIRPLNLMTTPPPFSERRDRDNEFKKAPLENLEPKREEITSVVPSSPRLKTILQTDAGHVLMNHTANDKLSNLRPPESATHLPISEPQTSSTWARVEPILIERNSIKKEASLAAVNEMNDETEIHRLIDFRKNLQPDLEPDIHARMLSPKVMTEVEPIIRERAKPETQTSSMPTIKVSIGRIEVRAVTPPVIPRPKRARAAPLMSLQEYLKQRNGGQR